MAVEGFLAALFDAGGNPLALASGQVSRTHKTSGHSRDFDIPTKVMMLATGSIS